MTDWFAFWAFLAVWVVCECVITLHGIDTVLWKFKTPPELVIQKAISEKAK